MIAEVQSTELRNIQNVTSRDLDSSEVTLTSLTYIQSYCEQRRPPHGLNYLLNTSLPLQERSQIMNITCDRGILMLQMSTLLVCDNSVDCQFKIEDFVQNYHE